MIYTINITQKSLAEQLNITDKVVSKWECRKSMPDHSLLQPLCEIANASTAPPKELLLTYILIKI